MPSYLIQLTYNHDVLAGFVKHPTDRGEVIRKLAAKMGGTVVGSWLAFGDYDAVIIIDGPDLVTSAACSMAVSSSGAFKAFKTTPMLNVEEGMAAMRKAGTLGYKPPSGKKK